MICLTSGVFSVYTVENNDICWTLTTYSMAMSPTYFILMVCLTIILNLALSGYNVVILKRIIDSIRPTRPDGEIQERSSRQAILSCRRKALIFGTMLAAFLRIGLTLILSDLLIFSYTKIAAGILLLWTSWALFRTLTRPAPEEESTHSTSLAEAIPQIIIADLALGLDNILGVACISVNHHAILIIGLIVSILVITFGVMLTPALMLRLRWAGWAGLVIMIGLSIHLIIRGYHDAFLIH
ncbi:hypothetical protein NQF86_02595 [Bombella sp. TMW 2.2543]|uniref:Uncharacterized protein n=1 Tax=Bombella pluederhausensis TaxID=2967336 RepID=A0ABT3WIV1_9PROT|nr:hypothetical protein [Bombella pluederhausensis]MCX5617563.1 hypothetical protein [Bombella pluederhausensis]